MQQQKLTRANPDFISREELERVTDARLQGTLIEDVHLAKKVAHTGMRLKVVRKEKGLTQVQLAEECGLDPGAISQLENGLRNPTFETINALCDALNVTSDYLMGRRPESYDDILQDDTAMHTLRKILHFSSEQRGTILDFINFVDSQNAKKMSETEKN